jgi:hypothetical protein
MNGGWRLVDLTSRLLERKEREAVLGDLTENGEPPRLAVMGVLGLALRRQAMQWRSWRPWVAGFGVALPSSYLLMGTSLSVAWSYMRLLCPEQLAQASLSKPSAFLVLLWQAFLLIGWSWTGGFVVGSVSRRTLWASTLLCYWPCLSCLWQFRIEPLSRFCLLLFLLPAIWGVLRGLRISGISLTSALIAALSLTLLMIPTWSDGHWRWWSTHQWTCNWALSLPAWYLVFAAWKTTRSSAASGREMTVS